MMRGQGKGTRSETGFVWVDPDGLPSGTESTTGTRHALDLEFEWYQLCHGCAKRKWFTAMICDECREQHGV